MKEIALTKGMVALVDDFDYEILSKYTWCASETTKKGVFYAKTYIKLKPFYMHRMIMGVADRNIFVDHIDRNTLNNQRDNLRQCNRGQNRCNASIQGTMYSQYKGVSKNSTFSGIWMASISINGKSTIIGRFDTEIEAALAYNEAAIKQFGEFAVLNDIKELV